jgi:cytosine/adenosine deaminase-related metal-dependent hydrolase
LEILEAAVQTADGLPHARCRVALSPHAPYSTLPELIRATAQVSRKRGWPFCMHVAESAHEFDMFMHGHGEMFTWLSRNKRDMSDCGDVSPVQQVDKLGALDRHLLAVHVNYLAEGDAALLGRHHANVVHCPRSHEYFNHTPFPHRVLKKAGVNICLGTDSLATVLGKPKQKIELSMLEETRAFASANENLSAREILQMATINGARALGLAGQVGELSEDALADLIAIPATTPRSEAFEAVLYHAGPVAASMIDGRWAVPPQTE